MSETDYQNFDPYQYIDGLIEEMGMQDQYPTKLSKLKDAMFKALSQQLFQAASENIEPEVVDEVMEEVKDEKDIGYILYRLLKSSPGATLAMREALDEFKANTLEAFNVLKNDV